MTEPPHVRLTAHARAMLEERYIEPDWLFRTLESPLWIEPDRARPGIWLAFGRIPAAGDRILRVVYTEQEEERWIVTAFFDRGARRRMKERES